MNADRSDDGPCEHTPTEEPPSEHDTTEAQSREGRVCVVAVQEDTFERCRNGFYPAPRSYDRTREPFDFLALYRTAPVSAVTQYAPVTDRIEQTRGGPGPMSEADWAATVDPFSDERVVVVFELGDLVPLATPVRNDQTGVRGAWYCTLDDLREAGTLSELSAAAQA
ncbi:hypothetical protein [Halobellus clavatus]|jgi:hypothetical protein|uniref:Uncharacterized protein n=1 Tax=Halobellus clavatus TaxID=660517 RepID=A0A1H3KE70_9EURY|nr:hypothetical protein [Halobellus clavatus]SDY50376.1 hypothetical protein SAMN04487946_1196 [Halobellus clavatus]